MGDRGFGQGKNSTGDGNITGVGTDLKTSRAVKNTPLSQAELGGPVAPKSSVRKKKMFGKGAKPKRSVSWSQATLIGNVDQPEFEHPVTSMPTKRNDFDSALHHYRIDQQIDVNASRWQTADPSKSTVPSSTEHSRRLAAFGISLTNALSDVIVIYPCLVLRRQCQMSNVGRRYHFTPFTIIGVAISLQRSQGFTCLWKGVGSHLMVNALSFGVESGLSEMSSKLPREIDRHTKLKDMAGHMILKAITSAIIMPFHSAHLVESIQSEAASETPGIFYFLTEGFSRLFGFAGVQTRRMLPFRQLLIPTVIYFLLRYILSNALRCGIISAYRFHERRKHERDLNNAHPFSPTETTYMAVPGTSSSSTQQTQIPVNLTVSSPGMAQHHELLSTFISQLVTDVMLYPYETILYRLHVQGTRTIIDDMDRGSGFKPVSSRYEGFLDCFSTVKNYEGSGGLYRGFGGLILQHLLKFAILKLTCLVVKFTSPNM